MSQEPPPQRPPIDDPVLGRLEWDDEETLLGEIEYRPGKRVTLLLVADYEEVDFHYVVNRAAEALERFRQDERRYRLWTGAELNRTRWNDEIQMADEDVANLLFLATLEFHQLGGMSVFWNDHDELYAGHSLCTEIGPGGECVRAGMY